MTKNKLNLKIFIINYIIYCGFIIGGFFMIRKYFLGGCLSLMFSVGAFASGVLPSHNVLITVHNVINENNTAKFYFGDIDSGTADPKKMKGYNIPKYSKGNFWYRLSEGKQLYFYASPEFSIAPPSEKHPYRCQSLPSQPIPAVTYHNDKGELLEKVDVEIIGNYEGGYGGKYWDYCTVSPCYGSDAECNVP